MDAEHQPISPQAAPPSAPTPRRLLLWGLLALLLLAAGAIGMMSYSLLFRPVALTKPQIVDIRRGASFGYVATRLEQRGIIPSALAFRIYGKLTGKANLLKIGEYEVTSGQRPVDTLDLLISGRARAFWLTVPEGKWASEVPDFVASHWPDAASVIRQQITSPARWRGQVPYPLTGNTLEGYLFPDTYLLPKGASGEQITRAMLQRFGETCWAAYQAHPPKDGRTFHDVLVLASLVEAEAKVAAERPAIAGVYLNRLKKGMLLQCDATVLYAHQKRLTRVLFRDLEIASPYNTYRYLGLPPGPICNPGLSSFTAALQPQQHGYYYYVAKGDGSHVFTRTMAEHTAAIRRIRGK